MTKAVVQSRVGIECRHCRCRHFYVIYTRRAAGGRLVRRRECRNCGRRMTTVEQEHSDEASEQV